MTDRLFRSLLLACGVLAVAVVLALWAGLVVGLLAAAPEPAAGSWVTAALGSVVIVAVAMGVGVPLGTGAGVWLAEYARPGSQLDWLHRGLHDLAAVPSVVYGVFGLAVFVNLLHFEGSAVAGGLTLAVLSLPAIVLATEEAVRDVPRRQREAALALGATRFQVIWRVVLPDARRRIGGGVLLALARTVGEAAPLLVTGAALTAGYAALPHRLFAVGPGREAFLIALALAALATGLHLAASGLRRRLPEGVP